MFTQYRALVTNTHTNHVVASIVVNTISLLPAISMVEDKITLLRQQAHDVLKEDLAIRLGVIGLESLVDGPIAQKNLTTYAGLAGCAVNRYVVYMVTANQRYAVYADGSYELFRDNEEYHTAHGKHVIQEISDG